MLQLVRKYRFIIITLLVLAGLLLLFIPQQERHYLAPDFKMLKQQTHTVLLWTLGVSFITILLLRIKLYKGLTYFLRSLAGIGILTLSAYFFFQPLFLSTALFINQLSKEETVSKTYKVVHVDGKRSLMLWDSEFKTHVQANQLIQQTHIQNIKVSDTLVVAFKKGWLGYLFDPAIE